MNASTDRVLSAVQVWDTPASYGYRNITHYQVGTRANGQAVTGQNREPGHKDPEIFEVLGFPVNKDDRF